MVFFGSTIFKAFRLLVVACFSVHLFACVFYRIKNDSNDPDTVANFYESKSADPDVRKITAAT